MAEVISQRLKALVEQWRVYARNRRASANCPGNPTTTRIAGLESAAQAEMCADDLSRLLLLASGDRPEAPALTAAVQGLRRWNLIPNEPWMERWSTGEWVKFSEVESALSALTQEPKEEKGIPEAEPAKESLAVMHARKQGAADGFQRGWHGALTVIADGGHVDYLRDLVPNPIAAEPAKPSTRDLTLDISKRINVMNFRELMDWLKANHGRSAEPVERPDDERKQVAVRAMLCQRLVDEGCIGDEEIGCTRDDADIPLDQWCVNCLASRLLALTDAEPVERAEKPFHPDWSRLEATQASLREHMALLRDATAENTRLRTDNARIKELATKEHTLLIGLMGRLQQMGHIHRDGPANMTMALHGILSGYVTLEQERDCARQERDGLRAELSRLTASSSGRIILKDIERWKPSVVSPGEMVHNARNDGDWVRISDVEALLSREGVTNVPKR